MAQLTTAQQSIVSYITVGALGIPPGGYMEVLSNILVANGGSYGALVNGIVNSDVFQKTYPTFLSADQFASKYATALLGSTHAGLKTATDFMTAQLNAGVSRADVVTNVLTFLYNAKSDATFGDVATKLANQATVAAYYTIDKQGTATDLTTLQAVLSNVTKESASVDAAKTAISTGNGSSGSAAGNTFSLTAANAVLTPTTSSGVTPAGTMTASSDVVDGLTFTGAFVQDASTTDSDVFNTIVNVAQTPTLVNIETVNATMAGNTLTVDNMTGTTRINVNGANGTILTAANSIPTTTTIGLDAGYVGTLTYQAALANATAPNDALNLVLNGSGAGARLNITNNGTTAGVGVALETLNVNVAANSALTLGQSADDTYTNVVVTGAGNLTLGAVANTVVTGTISAATSTGSLNATLGSATIANNATIVGSNQADTFTGGVAAVTAIVSAGLGDDVFNSGAFAVTNNITYRGGDATGSANGGNDTVNLNSSFAHDLSNFSNIDTITVAQGTAGATSVQLANTTGFLGTTITINGGSLTTAGNTLAVGIGGVAAGDVGTATDYFLNITGGSLNDTLNGGSRADTINGGAGNDNITGGAGADIINVGTGTDRVVYSAASESFSGVVTSGTTVLTGVDVISGMAAGDTIGMYAAATVTGATTAGTSLLAGAGATDAVAIVRGNYNATTGIFTTSVTGADSLYQWDSNGTAAAGAIENIVLVGFTGTVTAGTNLLTLA